MLAWKATYSAFSNKRDFALLLFALPIASLVASQGVADAAAAIGTVGQLGRLLLVSLAGCLAHLAVSRRLTHLNSESIIAHIAVQRGPSLVYRLFWNAPPLFASISVIAGSSAATASSPSRVSALIFAYALGAGMGALLHGGRKVVRAWCSRRRAASKTTGSFELSGEPRLQRIRALIIARTGLAGPSIARSVALFAACGVAIAFLLSLSSPSASRWPLQLHVAAAALLAASAVGFLLRQHPPLLRYLLYLGIAPVGPALVPGASACSLAAGLVVGAAANDLDQLAAFAVIALAALLLFFLVTALRALHAATRTDRGAVIAFQIDAAVMLLTAFVMPPLAFPILLMRLVLLHRRATSLKYRVQ
jgi:hypothetical protein